MNSLQVDLQGKTFPGVAQAPPHQALASIKFSIKHGQFACITGPSGCGKTTLLNVLAGLDQDYDGEIHLPFLSNHRQPVIGYVFQAPPIFSALLRQCPASMVKINSKIALF